MEDWLKRNLVFKPFDQNIEIKAGDVLKLKNGETHLVGDVNEVLGVCEDCTIFKSDDIEEIGNIYEFIDNACDFLKPGKPIWLNENNVKI